MSAERAEQLQVALNCAQNALRAICTASDSGPWIDVYRAKGGGYEGLQAIAEQGLRLSKLAAGEHVGRMARDVAAHRPVGSVDEAVAILRDQVGGAHGPTIYAQLLDRATKEPLHFLRASLEGTFARAQVELVERLADHLREAYLAGTRDGYHEGLAAAREGTGT